MKESDGYKANFQQVSLKSHSLWACNRFDLTKAPKGALLRTLKDQVLQSERKTFHPSATYAPISEMQARQGRL